MKPLNILERLQLPDNSLLELWERDGVISLQKDGQQLSNSFQHGADDALGHFASQPFRKAGQPKILLDGLLLGFALSSLTHSTQKEKAEFIVAEPCQDLVEWNKKYLKEVHAELFEDPRIKVVPETALRVARRQPKTYHAIVKNSCANGSEYKIHELVDFKNSLKEGGLLVIACSKHDTRIARNLEKAGFILAKELVPVSHKGKQSRFLTIFLAKKGFFSAATQAPAPRQRAD